MINKKITCEDDILSLESSDRNQDLTYLKDLLLACWRVHNKYSKWVAIHGAEQTERVFAYELYHQFRLISSKNKSEYQNLQINGELKKRYTYPQRIFNYHNVQYSTQEYRSKMKDRNYFSFEPDLVLHESQLEDHNHQELMIEIKTGNCINDAFSYDFLKLLNGINHLNFKFGILLSVNFYQDWEMENIKHYFGNSDFIRNNKDNLEKLVLIIYKNDEQDKKIQLVDAFTVLNNL